MFGSYYDIASGGGSATLWITDNDVAATVSVAATQNAAEGGQNGVFTFTRDVTAGSLTVYYGVNEYSSTATYYSDYTGPSPYYGSVTFPSGQSSVTLSVTAVDDSEVESSESVVLSIEDGYMYGSTYTIASGGDAATLWITDNDVAATASVAATQNATEGGQNGVFTFTRDVTAGSLTVYYGINEYSSTAAYSYDYTGPSQYYGSVTFPSGQSSVTLSVTAVDDSEEESSESVVLVIEDGYMYGSTYTIASGGGSATLWITDNDGTPTDHPPEVQNSTKTATEDTVLTLAAAGFTGNFSDVDSGDTLQAVKVTQLPANGTLKLSGTAVAANEEIAAANLGNLAYEPTADYSGPDSFQWKATDGTAYSTTAATLSITVSAVHDLPVVSDSSKTVVENAVLEFAAADFTAHFSDVDTGDALQTVKITALAAHGTLKLSGTAVTADQEIAAANLANLTYQGNQDYRGPDSFQWKASDGTAYSASAATVSITVTMLNHAPSFTKGADQQVDEDAGPQTVTAWATNISPGPPDESGQTLTFQVTSNSNATLFSAGPAVDPASGNLSYTPAPDANGVATISLVLVDDGGTANGGSDTSAEQTFTITVNAVNEAPSADGQQVAVEYETAKAIVLTGEDGDAGVTQVLTFAIQDQPSHGTLSGFDAATGGVVYTPQSGYTGPDSFTFTVTDDTWAGSPANLTSAAATVGLVVRPPNHAPVAGDDSYSTQEDTVLVVGPANGLLANDSDADGDPTRLTVISAPSHGRVLLGDDGRFAYVPDANFFGADSFTYEINDDRGGTDTAVVTITVAAVNDRPIAAGDRYRTRVGQAASLAAQGGVLANDRDPDGDAITAVLVTGPSHGTLNLGADGSFTYTPEENYIGSDTFRYKASDGQLDSNVVLVRIAVEPANAAPVAVDDAYTVAEDTALRVLIPNGVLGNDSDADGDFLAALLVTAPAHGTLLLHASGALEYLPQEDFNGSDSFTYKVTDGRDTSAAEKVWGQAVVSH